MDGNFFDDELLLRAVCKRPCEVNFYKKSKKISSAVFKDEKGVSVFRTGDRTLEVSLVDIRQRLMGPICYVTVQVCSDNNIHIVWCPSVSSNYHCELWQNSSTKLLTEDQAFALAENAVLVEEDSN